MRAFTNSAIDSEHRRSALTLAAMPIVMATWAAALDMAIRFADKEAPMGELATFLMHGMGFMCGAPTVLLVTMTVFAGTNISRLRGHVDPVGDRTMLALQAPVFLASLPLDHGRSLVEAALQSLL